MLIPQTTATKRQRLSPQLRRDRLLNTALKIARNYGLATVHHQAIAQASHTSVATVFHYFPTRQALDEALTQHIITHEKPSLLRLEAELAFVRMTYQNHTSISELERQLPEERLTLSRYIHF
ncbi:TetR family transcriptional regulator [Celerinatantimonas yamalensis]|uniref:TetR family transcriptional regulator n=1 Tax=Celerinatantimonas yamalensis TaxID=559956 RepID=A0ABW9G4W7_9GAMM